MSSDSRLFLCQVMSAYVRLPLAAGWIPRVSRRKKDLDSKLDLGLSTGSILFLLLANLSLVLLAKSFKICVLSSRYVEGRAGRLGEKKSTSL